jgi:hypothetical protein
LAGLQDRFHAAVADRCADCWAVRMCGLCYAALASVSPETPTEETQVPVALCDQQRSENEVAMRRYIDLMAKGDCAIDWLPRSIVR